MCLSLEEKTRAKAVISELDGVSKKIIDLSRIESSTKHTSHSFQQEQLLNLHSSLIRELQVFIERC